MRLLKLSILFSVLYLSIDYESSSSDVAGLYISKDPSFIDKVTIMYTRGYYNFLYSPAGDIILDLKKDKTFIHKDTYCKVGVVESKGDWSIKDNEITLYYDDSTYVDEVYKLTSNQIYRIYDISLEDEPRITKSLILMEKK